MTVQTGPAAQIASMSDDHDDENDDDGIKSSAVLVSNV